MSELTTSKINRQFRTLRSKCAALNSISHGPRKPAVTVTYGHSSRNHTTRLQAIDDVPPLAILQSLDKLSSRLHLNRAIHENMQLSKCIYEVRDAFKNMIQSSSAAITGGPLSSRIPSLAGLCARLIGEHVQTEMDASLDDHSDVEGHEDTLRSQAMDGLYESVPSQYRHHTMIAHALTYILDTCPHHPTLLNALLEVCITYHLVPEACTVLSKLFTTSILPRPNSGHGCPLTHPAHKNFLTTLRETCTGATTNPSALQTSTPSIINDRTFTNLLVDALSQPCPEQLPAWTSRATVRLARELRDQDLEECFMTMCVGLAHSLHCPPETPKTKGRSTKTLEDVHSEAYTAALDRLAKWVISMRNFSHSPNASGLPRTEQYSARVSFLTDIYPLQLHISTSPATSPTTGLADAICCLAALCITSEASQPHSLSAMDRTVLQNLLREAHVKQTTFDGLISSILPLPSFEIFCEPLSHVADVDAVQPPTSLPTRDDGIRAIEALSIPLRNCGLLQSEASIYSSSLRHVEELISVLQGPSPPYYPFNIKELYDLRLQLMDRVDDAELRCYSGVSGGVPPPPGGSCEWRWEEMVGSWVAKSPAVAQAKKMKDDEMARAHKRRKIHDRQGASASISTSSRPAPRRHSETPRWNFPVLSDPADDGGILTYTPIPVSKRGVSRPCRPVAEDKENISRDETSDSSDDEMPQTPVPKPPRRGGGFATILADSRLNKISLRDEREAAIKAKAKAKGRVSAPARVVRFAVPESPASASPATPRTPVGFRTALADSHRNVIRLNEVRARERLAAAQKARETSDEGTGSKRKRSHAHAAYGKWLGDSEDEPEQVAETPFVEPESSPARPAYLEPSSDDALNLFAYPDSSPVKGRRRALP